MAVDASINEAKLRGIDLKKLETERFTHFNHIVSMLRHYERAEQFYSRLNGVNTVLAFGEEYGKNRAKVQQNLEREEAAVNADDAINAIDKANEYLDRYQTVTIVAQNYLANKMSAEVAMENIIRVIGEEK